MYATIANQGVRVQPTLVAGSTNARASTPRPRRPRRGGSSRPDGPQLIGGLQQVPAVDEEANQPWGIIPGYAIAAKTGTSQEGCHQEVPVQVRRQLHWDGARNNPQVVVAVNVQNPKKGGYFGDVVAGPVFYKVMTFALQTLKIPPPGASRGRAAHRALIGGNLSACPWPSVLADIAPPALRPGRAARA